MEQLTAGMAPGGSLSQPFTASMMAQYSPAYQFQLQQGQQAAQRAAAAAGVGGAGGTLRSLNRLRRTMPTAFEMRPFYITKVSKYSSTALSSLGLEQQPPRPAGRQA